MAASERKPAANRETGQPVDGLVQGKKGLLRQAIKCRGREYLRIIYGPTYTEPANLVGMRHRALAPKRTLGLRAFVLGHESLHRFVEREPLYRVHECVWGVGAGVRADRSQALKHAGA